MIRREDLFIPLLTLSKTTSRHLPSRAKLSQRRPLTQDLYQSLRKLRKQLNHFSLASSSQKTVSSLIHSNHLLSSSDWPSTSPFSEISSANAARESKIVFLNTGPQFQRQSPLTKLTTRSSCSQSLCSCGASSLTSFVASTKCFTARSPPTGTLPTQGSATLCAYSSPSLEYLTASRTQTFTTLVPLPSLVLAPST